MNSQSISLYKCGHYILCMFVFVDVFLVVMFCFLQKKYYYLSTTDTFPVKSPYLYNSGNFDLLAPVSMWLASNVIYYPLHCPKCDLPSLPPHTLQKPPLFHTACMELMPISAATCHQSSFTSLSGFLGLIFTITKYIKSAQLIAVPEQIYIWTANAFPSLSQTFLWLMFAVFHYFDCKLNDSKPHAWFYPHWIEL